jgi:Domain of unknown function (DUF1707)
VRRPSAIIRLRTLCTVLEPSRGRLRASHADREQVMDVLKAALVQGRLTRDELDARLAQALASRTYAELAVVASAPRTPTASR